VKYQASGTRDISDFIKGHATIIRSCLGYLEIGALDHYVSTKHHRNVDVGRRKFDVDHGHSVYIADDVGSFESASSDNDSSMDSGEVGVLMRELGTALSQMCLNSGSDLKISTYSENGPVAKGASESKLGPDSDNAPERKTTWKTTCHSENDSNLEHCLDFYAEMKDGLFSAPRLSEKSSFPMNNKDGAWETFASSSLQSFLVCSHSSPNF
jgi:hypothetical protein